MADVSVYPLRVVRGEDGVLRWSGAIDKKHQRVAYRIVLLACGGALLFFVLASLVINPEMFGVTFLICLGVMAIPALVCFVFDRLTPDPQFQAFELGEDFIHWVGYGKTDFIYSLRSIRRARVKTAEHMIVLTCIPGVMHVYIPPEDFSYVRDFLLLRLPATAKIKIT